MRCFPNRYPSLCNHKQMAGIYAVDYRSLDQKGTYRVVVYAEDYQGLQSRAKEVVQMGGWQLYLPTITR